MALEKFYKKLEASVWQRNVTRNFNYSNDVFAYGYILFNSQHRYYDSNNYSFFYCAIFKFNP